MTFTDIRASQIGFTFTPFIINGVEYRVRKLASLYQWFAVDSQGHAITNMNYSRTVKDLRSDMCSEPVFTITSHLVDERPVYTVTFHSDDKDRFQNIMGNTASQQFNNFKATDGEVILKTNYKPAAIIKGWTASDNFRLSFQGVK